MLGMLMVVVLFELKTDAFFNCLTLAMHYEMVAHHVLAVFNSIAFKSLYLLCFNCVKFPYINYQFRYSV